MREPLDNPPIRPGDWVRVSQGVFAGFEGRVDEYLAEQDLVRVVIHVYGRTSCLEVDLDKVEPSRPASQAVQLGDPVEIVRGPLSGSIGVVRDLLDDGKIVRVQVEKGERPGIALLGINQIQRF